MPAAITHKICMEETKERLNSETLVDLPNYNSYTIFAQGHDAFIYPDIKNPWRLKSNKNISKLMQDTKFNDTIYQYLKIAKETGAIEDEVVRLFIYGYINHHILDSYTHPFINYFSGSHEPIFGQETWQHGNMEAAIDAYILKEKRELDLNIYPTHEHLLLPKQDYTLVKNTINNSFYLTYGYPNIGKRAISGFEQFHIFTKYARFDPHGTKLKIYKKIEQSIGKYGAAGIKSFSNYVSSEEGRTYINLEHKKWIHPSDSNIVSVESFMDLYEKALEHNTDIINKLEALAKKSIIHQDDIKTIVPDVGAVSGLPCNIHYEIENTKQKNLIKTL